MKQNIKTTQKQSFALSQKISQMLYVLSLPIYELSKYVSEEIEKNPLLSPKKDFTISKQTRVNYATSESNDYFLSSIKYSETLYEHLLKQAKYHFKNKNELEIASIIIGSINQHGFLDTDKTIDQFAKELKTTKRKITEIIGSIQQFSPLGIATKNTQEFLLHQLKDLKKESTFTYKIIKNNYSDLLQKNLKNISKVYQVPINSIIKNLKKDLSNLAFIPSHNFIKSENQDIISDIKIVFDQNKWIISINNELLPEIVINKNLINDKILSKKDKLYINKNIKKGGYLINAIENRKSLLYEICKYIIQKQHQYLLNKSHLSPMTLNEIAQKLNVNVSTISRAISNKYILCPLGIKSIKSFFSCSIKKSSCSNKQAIETLKILIEKENKKMPLSDIKLSKKLQSQNIYLSRRTISKYRKLLKIPKASARQIN